MEHFDVVIVGAGISGVGAAVHLQERCPNKRWVILEGRGSMGGTWDLFRYPGIRSDSDMYTLGYRFKPWRGKNAIAGGPEILSYVKEAAAEHGVDRHIRYRHRARAARWSSADRRWTLEIEREGSSERLRMSCNFLLMCAGYYSYEGGYTPELPGVERFGGRLVHPQSWPEDLDYRGKRVVVIGSGATAVTLVPAMSKDVEHIVMLQRSPTYMLSLPAADPIAGALGRVLPERFAYAATRWKNVGIQRLLYGMTRKRPETMKKLLLGRVKSALGPRYDVTKHFTPRYHPWDERLCFVPDDDFFEAIRSGKASVVTDSIETFTEKGLRLSSGEELDADIVVTATGLNLVVLGQMKFEIDGEPVDFSKTWTYKGLMSSGVPNLVSTFGYVNASWTLRADLTSEWVCRLLSHMDAVGSSVAVPRLRPSDAEMPARPWIADFSPNYIKRVLHLFPKQGDREPWLNPQDYALDKKRLGSAPIDDGVLSMS